ncbi:indolepyruvate oxidoreductase subunit beta family protein [Porphyrobacter algicida]|uniref:Indolepyruvate oxidoreductase subunit beta family protein n=1 Tax=Qipengyuania algicida TaxID=1836209 RepID=A0A845AK92_9SPHN|nr:indolepyruvate oxidoreductase subunit beta family protein [Qipengyuania algicida]MXP29275.1 indolepyruvate oxidoreductase subunit beta family protein [Qipengyuania algicida]
MTRATERDRITLAIMALGGQGGGVLANWILDVANANGYVAQGTSVPGVAQRTGATIYYIEMMKSLATSGNQSDPVLAMMPAPGDVDIVVASELMEAGRAILRGFVTEDRTTLIGSTHRIYAISEKSAPGNGISASERIIDAAKQRAARFIGFDMEQAASDAGSVISSVMLGALAGSKALPFPRDAFAEAIRRSGKAIEANLSGFEAGISLARDPQVSSRTHTAPLRPTSTAGRSLAEAIETMLPESARPIALEGVARLMDYQDRQYAELYLDLLDRIYQCDDGSEDWRLTQVTARHLALWMAYEDTIRVADLKVRASRSRRIAEESRAGNDQLVRVTDYLHPRIEEVCDILPRALGSAILNGKVLRSVLNRFFSGGRHVETTRLRWYFALRFIASLRRWRRGTLRYTTEMDRIEAWLDLAADIASEDSALAIEVINAQRLLKGYSDTFERGFARFEAIQQLARGLRGKPDAASRLRTLNEAALADEEGKAFDYALAEECNDAAA